MQKRQTPLRGLDGWLETNYFSTGVDGEDRVVRCITPVKHQHPSACLDGETTRRQSLNLDRGGGPLGAQREARKREPQRGNP